MARQSAEEQANLGMSVEIEPMEAKSADPLIAARRQSRVRRKRESDAVVSEGGEPGSLIFQLGFLSSNRPVDGVSRIDCCRETRDTDAGS